MKFNKKKRGFTIIESLVYIFLTTLILAEGINLYVSIYKSYLEEVCVSDKYNNYQSFFINIENIIAQGEFDRITVEDNTLLFFEKNNEKVLGKKINSYGGNVALKDMDTSPEIMIENIDKLEIKTKGKLIYLILRDKDGKEFIKCI